MSTPPPLPSANSTSSITSNLPTLQPNSAAIITIILAIYYLFSTSLLAALLAIRTLSIENLDHWPLFKILTCMALLMAYLFNFVEGFLSLGLGRSRMTMTLCVIGTWVCIVLYMLFKLMYYAFLIERVHLVYSSKRNIKIRRLQAPWYRISLLVILAWFGVAISMIIGRITEPPSQQTNICKIGVHRYAAISLAVMDSTVCSVLTLAFALPVWRSRFSKAQRLALTSCIATTVGTLTSLANLLYITKQEGREHAWLRGLSSSFDIMIIACIIFIITNARSNSKRREASQQLEILTAGAVVKQVHLQHRDSSHSDSEHTNSISTATKQRQSIRPLDGVVMTSQVVRATEEADIGGGDTKVDDDPRYELKIRQGGIEASDIADLEASFPPTPTPQQQELEESQANTGWLDRILYERAHAKETQALENLNTPASPNATPFTANTIILKEPPRLVRPKTAPLERTLTSLSSFSILGNKSPKIRGTNSTSSFDESFERRATRSSASAQTTGRR